MFKKIVFLIILSLGLCADNYANNLSVTSGEIKAHTEVFGDSEINPTTKDVKANLTIGNSLESIKGQIFFETLTLISDKKQTINIKKISLIYSQNQIFIIKPKQLRYWLKSVALLDVDTTIADIINLNLVER